MKHESSAVKNRLPWVEPAVAELNVRDTQQMCGVGGDAEFTSGNAHPDCTKS